MDGLENNAVQKNGDTGDFLEDGLNKIVRAIKSLKWYEIIMCLVMFGISIYYAIMPQEGCPQWLAIINMISGLCGKVSTLARGLGFGDDLEYTDSYTLGKAIANRIPVNVIDD